MFLRKKSKNECILRKKIKNKLIIVLKLIVKIKHYLIYINLTILSISSEVRVTDK